MTFVVPAEYMSASMLNIAPIDREALAWFVQGVRSGVIPEHDFTMRTFMRAKYDPNSDGVTPCGTKHCVGGWVGIYKAGCPTDPGGRKWASQARGVGLEPGLDWLFYPKYDRGWTASAAEAANVVDRFLRTGEKAKGW